MSRQREDGSFGPGEKIVELSTTADDRMPNVRRDGLEIVFSSSRGGTGQDIYTSTRPDTASPWSPPQLIDNPAINTPGSGKPERRCLATASALYFGRKVDSNDPGDIFVSTRSKTRGTASAERTSGKTEERGRGGGGRRRGRFDLPHGRARSPTMCARYIGSLRRCEGCGFTVRGKR